MDKTEEKEAFSRFIDDLVGDLKFDTPKPPLPDITFMLNEQNIGLEIAEIKSDSVPKVSSNISAGYSNIDKLVKQLNEYISQKSAYGFWIQINILDASKFKKKSSVQVTFEQVVEKFERYMLSENKPSSTSLNTWDINGISSLRISNESFLENIESHCTLSTHIWTPKIGHDHIQEYIKTKTEKKLKYLGMFDKYWLLLVYNFNISSDFDLASAYDKVDTSCWDKIYLFDYQQRKINEITAQNIG